MRDVCNELRIDCVSKDIRFGFDACDPSHYVGLGTFEFCFLHPPYWRQKVYSDDLRDMSMAPTLSYFLHRYDALIRNCASVSWQSGRFWRACPTPTSRACWTPVIAKMASLTS